QLINPRVVPSFSTDLFAENIYLEKNILLRQAIMNLIDNAIYAAKQQVLINFTLADKNIVLTIQDDGEGIPKEIIENWGKPFLSKKEGGLGIGIFLANSTIERLGGEVHLKHSNLTTGSCIEILIPVITHKS